MLKIHHNRAELKKILEEHAKGLLPLLRKRLKRPANAVLKAYFLNDSLITEILIAPPNRLVQINRLIYKKLLVTYTKKQIDDSAKLVFDYADFKIRDHSKYRADKLYQNIGFKTCPYCNIRDIRPVTDMISGKVSARGALDHFFSESKHPLMTLSFYNLIPACTYCNTNFKLGKPMKLSKNLHPYLAGFNDNCVLDFSGFSNLDEIYGKKKGYFELYFKQSNTNKRYSENIKIFGLKAQYNGYKDNARLALALSKTYTKAVLDSIMATTHLKHYDAYEQIFHTKFKPNELHLNPLSKLNRDIVREYGNPDLKRILKIK